ncbi:ABC transporter permease [Paenibacillus sp. GCM10023252]|uniref:ABC transporter permease n=1 Tax=Paenibacillus sp. GCM10023252 TaxID=3252649 RepID=UPI00362443C3
MNGLRMYGLLVRASFRSRMQYKFNFWFSTLMAALINALEFIMLAAILWKFGSLKGWSLAEAGYLYALLTLSKALYRTLASDVHHLEKYLLSGDLDSLLVRPVPVLMTLMTQNFSVRIGEFVQGTAILAYCIRVLIDSGQVEWTVVPLSLFVILSGALLLFAIGLLTAALGFWFTRIEQLQNITEDAARTAAGYPLTIYPRWLQGVLIGIIPVAFANYMPSLYILRHETGPWMLGLSAAVGGAVMGIALLVWRLGLTRYQSTGS